MMLSYFEESQVLSLSAGLAYPNASHLRTVQEGTSSERGLNLIAIALHQEKSVFLHMDLI